MLSSDAVIGRSSAAALRIDDPRVSTIHAELSWRAEGMVLLARGGRLLVHGRGVREVVLVCGLEVALAPGITLKVVEVTGGSDTPVPPTAGRERLRFLVGDGVVVVGSGNDESRSLTGIPAQLLAALLHAGGWVPWERIAEELWPDEGAVRRSTLAGQSRAWTDVDERRLRNRFDQHLRSLRKELAPYRGGTLVEVQGGNVAVRLGPADTVADTEPSAPG